MKAEADALQMLYKANCVVDGIDIFAPLAPILKTLTYAGNTWRRRDIQEGEMVESAWDKLTSDKADLKWGTPGVYVSEEMPKNLVYTEADALEDQILFPENAGRGRFRAVENGLTDFESESERMKDRIMRHFLTGGDVSDDESDDPELRYLEDDIDEDDDDDYSDSAEDEAASNDDNSTSSQKHGEDELPTSSEQDGEQSTALARLERDK